MGELNAWAQKMPRPNAILMISAHWEDRPLTIGATVPVPLVYDFYGFPRAYYQLTYPSPGAPALAERVRSLLKTAGMSSQDLPERGLDHGAFIPLMAMYPSADVPVLQISLPSEDPQELFNLGMALDPLRSEGVLHRGKRLPDPQPPAPGARRRTKVGPRVRSVGRSSPGATRLRHPAGLSEQGPTGNDCPADLRALCPRPGRSRSIRARDGEGGVPHHRVLDGQAVYPPLGSVRIVQRSGLGLAGPVLHSLSWPRREAEPLRPMDNVFGIC